MVYRVYVEKKFGDNEAEALLSDVRETLGIPVEKIRILGRYDAEDIDEALFFRCMTTVFSDPQTDNASLGFDLTGARVFAEEYLPGRFDRRADSLAQSIQLVSMQNRPVIRTAKVYAVYGRITEAQFEKIKEHVIDPAERREAKLHKPETLKIESLAPEA